MKLYILIHEQDTDSAWGAGVLPFIDRNAAQDAMRRAYAAVIKAWAFDQALQTEEHECCCDDEKAVIRNNTEIESWRIEEHEADVGMAIVLEGGLIRDIYSNVDIRPQVFNLDFPEFPDEEEQKEAAAAMAQLESLNTRAGWRSVL